MDLAGKTLGIVGVGNVGSRVARFAQAFDMRVLGYDLVKAKGSNIRYVSLGDLLRQSDIISLHVPLTEQTKKMFNSEKMSEIKPGALLVNTARPGLLEFNVVKKLTQSGKIRTYAFDQGYLTKSEAKRLSKTYGFHVFPHISWYTSEAIQREMEGWIGNLIKLAEGVTVNPVNALCYV